MIYGVHLLLCRTRGLDFMMCLLMNALANVGSTPLIIKQSFFQSLWVFKILSRIGTQRKSKFFREMVEENL